MTPFIVLGDCSSPGDQSGQSNYIGVGARRFTAEYLRGLIHEARSQAGLTARQAQQERERVLSVVTAVFGAEDGLESARRAVRL